MGINIKQNDLIYPYFVIPGKNKKEPIKLFPGVYRFSIDRLIKDAAEARDLGLNKILLFGVPEKKDANGASAYAKGNIVASAIREIKKEFKDLKVFADVCLCAYTTHGHCGIVRNQKPENREQKKIIDNKKTLETLAKIAVSYAEAGADYVAPSAMAKNQVAAIRKALDKKGSRAKIMGYSAKFASNFYGPFRNAADSAPLFGDRRSYQLDYRDSAAAIKKIKADIKESADIVMVKPALSYLDIIKEAKNRFKHPLAAYNVSGEYAMVKAYSERIAPACRSGRDSAERIEVEKKLVLEILTSIKRAGADLIITYHAKDIARWIKDGAVYS